MSKHIPSLRLLSRPVLPIRQCIHQPRLFSTSQISKTDGVYQELTAMRTRVPFIEAFRQKEAEELRKTKDEVREVGGTPEGEGKAKVHGGEPRIEMKKMSDSYHSVILPLAKDPWLLDNYITASGHIRLGTIFMDLDALAGVVSYKHTGEHVMTVTAAVDRITLSRPLLEITDLEVSGQVTFATGRSSMEVTLQVAKAPSSTSSAPPSASSSAFLEDGEKYGSAPEQLGIGFRKKEDILMSCTFTMVSLDPLTKKPVKIAGIEPENEVERELFERGKRNYDGKKREQGRGLRSVEPEGEESGLIHRLWLQTLDYHDPNTPSRKPAPAHYMSSTTIQSVQIMQPQYRNRHNFMIFGGFLLKSTFELAFTCASAISHSRPTFIALDPSTFENPVPVGSVLYLTATLAYTDRPLLSTSPDSDSNPTASRATNGKTRVQIRVDTKVKNVEHGETKPTGQFNYTFEVDGEVQVLPESYREFMIYLDARRRSKMGVGNGERRD